MVSGWGSESGSGLSVEGLWLRVRVSGMCSELGSGLKLEMVYG